MVCLLHSYFYFFVILSIIWGFVRSFYPLLAASFSSPQQSFIAAGRACMHACLPAMHLLLAVPHAKCCAGLQSSCRLYMLTAAQSLGSMVCKACARACAQVASCIGILLPLWESRDLFARVISYGGPKNATLPTTSHPEIQLKSAGVESDYAHEGVHTADGDMHKM